MDKTDDRTGERTSFYQSYPIKSESIIYFAGLSEQSHAGKQRSTEQLWESEGFKGICKSSQFLARERDYNACTVPRCCIGAGIKKRYRDTNKRIKQAEKQLHERKELVDQSEKYLEYRPVYVK